MRRYTAVVLAVALVVIGAAQLGNAAPADSYSNGQFPSSALSPIRSSSGGTVQLAKSEAAASWNTLRICSTRAGVDLYTGGDGAYRSIAQQVARWQQYQNGTGNLAAYPGTSNHGWGRAVDVDLVRMATWIQAHGGWAGWYWGEAPSEWWHHTKDPNVHFSRPDPGPDVSVPRLSHGSGGSCQQYAVDEARRRLGLTQGRPFTTQMVAAVKSFQFAHRIARTGVIDGKTWGALRGTTRAEVHPAVLYVKSPPFQGQDVAAIQGQINARLKDVRNPNLIHVDGFFGPATGARLRYLQKYWWRIPVTGKTTATTRALLKKPLVRAPPAKPETGAENTSVPPTPAQPKPPVVHRGPMYGADTSEHNEAVNFVAARKRVEFVILRATWTGNTAGGLHQDAQLSNSNCQQARNAGLKIGFYDYDIAGKGGSARRVADHFTSTVWRLPACRWRVGDLLPAHDMEEGDGAAAAAWSRDWRQRVSHNIAVGLNRNLPTIEYGGSFAREIKPPDPGIQSPLWMPGYGNNDGRGLSTYWKGYYTPTAWRSKGWWIAVYQYWSEGRWTASSGAVDFNIIENPDYWLPRLLVR